MRVGLLGLGSIGATVLERLVAGKLGAYEVVRAVDSRKEKRGVAEAEGVPFSTDAGVLLSDRPDLVVEMASQAAVREWGEALLSNGINLVILSIGALADESLRGRLEKAAENGNSHVHLPSGAIGALDALKAAAMSGLTTVRLTTTKPPVALAGAPATQEIDLSRLTAPTTVFCGSAAEAARLLPQNLNVAVSVSLAGVGVDSTTVEVVADPAGRVNSHRLEAQGEFGRLDLLVENVPSPDNPRTSYLAVLSTLALLRQLQARIHVGT